MMDERVPGVATCEFYFYFTYDTFSLELSLAGGEGVEGEGGKGRLRLTRRRRNRRRRRKSGRSEKAQFPRSIAPKTLVPEDAGRGGWRRRRRIRKRLREFVASKVTHARVLAQEMVSLEATGFLSFSFLSLSLFDIFFGICVLGGKLPKEICPHCRK